MQESVKKKVLILLDRDRRLEGKLVGSIDNYYLGEMDIDSVVSLLSRDYEVEVERYDELDLRKSYREYFVIYASSEERGLLYKDYIEDILLRLQLDGAILIPEFKYFRAHHNKAFQECLRLSEPFNEINTFHSWVVDGEYDIPYDKLNKYPYIVKASAGSGSSGVVIVNNIKELKREVRRLSKVLYRNFFYSQKYDLLYNKFTSNIKNYVHRKVLNESLYYNRVEHCYSKVIIQEFIENLSYDYKVLKFSERYYVLKRENRKDDFRASGSGSFVFPHLDDEVRLVLSFANNVGNIMDEEILSLDIGYDGINRDYHLIEFQLVMFGKYTMQFAECFFELNNNGEWIAKKSIYTVEEEYAESMKKAIQKKSQR